MSYFESSNPYETHSRREDTSATTEKSAPGSSGGTNDTPSPRPPTAAQSRRSGARRFLTKRRGAWIAAGAALTCAAILLSVDLATSQSATATHRPSAAGGGGGGASNARSGPATGGASGIVGSVSASSFTITTSAGQKVTVDEASTTTYQKAGTTSISASAVRTGESVLAMGTTSGTTIAATQVVVQPTGGGTASSVAGQVMPFQRGAPTTSKQVGQIPANWGQGSGTIVSGTAANKATEAALAAYPGGIVDRVVKLSNGEYNVHYIGVNWPHHVFVNQNFKFVGAL